MSSAVKLSGHMVSFVAACFMMGCSTTSRHELEHQVVTRIVSEPPGARIEINGEYIGDAPLETRIRHHPSDRVVMGRVVIRALPTDANHYVQLRELNGPQIPFDSNRDVVPEIITFDMSREPLAGVAARGTGPSGKYPGLSQTRWINKSIDRGALIELDDRSLWRISPGDRTKTSQWMKSESVVVHEGVNPEFPYTLVGKRGTVEAVFVPQ